MENQTSLPRNGAEIVSLDQNKKADFSQIILHIETWSAVLNARLLAVLALGGALGIFGYAIDDPSPLRLWACAGYSVGVLWPVIWLYLNKGGQS